MQATCRDQCGSYLSQVTTATCRAICYTAVVLESAGALPQATARRPLSRVQLSYTKAAGEGRGEGEGITWLRYHHEKRGDGEALWIYLHCNISADGGQTVFTHHLRSKSPPNGRSDGVAMESCLRRIHVFLLGRTSGSMRSPTAPLSFLENNKTGGVNIFSNGAGKMFTYQLLNLVPLGVYARVATTSDPRYDWCGVEWCSMDQCLVWWMLLW